MTISQQPVAGNLYFQNSIPDIVCENPGSETVLSFELKYNSELILSEDYEFDTVGVVRIRDLKTICAMYLENNSTVVATDLASISGLVGLFTVVITCGTVTISFEFSVLKCDAQMPAGLDAGTWTDKNFLSRSYLQKRTAINRQEYLSFLSKQKWGQLTLNYKITYQSDSIAEKSGTLITIPSAEGIIHTMNVSLLKLMAAAELDAERVLTYEVWMSGTDLESNHYTFFPDYSVYRDKTNLIFINSFGVLETFTATGRIPVKKTQDISLANIEGRYRKTTQYFVAEKTIYTGHISKMEFDWLDDLLLSYSTGLYTPGTSGMSEEITITSIDVNDTGANDLKSFSFTYKNAENNHLNFAVSARGIFDETFDETFE